MLPGGSGRVKGAGLGPPVGGGRTPPPPAPRALTSSPPYSQSLSEGRRLL